MNHRSLIDKLPQHLLLATLLLFAAGVSLAQVPVDDQGNPVGEAVAAGDETVDAAPQRSTAELEDMVGRIALYPDDLLAIVLPASTYPLEIVQAARFLDEVEKDSSLQPDESWDESVTALLNYPEVLRMMNDDIDWTWQLGEAVVAQQSDVIAAVERFRDRAYAAGNLKSDEHQRVSKNDEVIAIDPLEDDVIYVPYYEPEEVVVYQPRRVYYYYPRAYPVYYYPYPVGYDFAWDYFWGVTTAFQIGWTNHYLHVYHPSFYGHPYYGYHYYGHYWRRPSVYVFNSYYGDYGYRHRYERHHDGSYWRPRHRGGARPGISQARSRYYPNYRGDRSQTRDVDTRQIRAELAGQRHGSGRLDARSDNRPAGATAARRDRRTVQPGTRGDRQPAERGDGGSTAFSFRERGPHATADRGQAVNRRDAAARVTHRGAAEQRRTRPAAVRPSPSNERSAGAVQRRAPAAADRRHTGRVTTPGNSQRPRASVAQRPRQPVTRSAPAPQRSAPVRRTAPASSPRRPQADSGSRSAPRAAPASRSSRESRGSRGRADSNDRRNHH